MEASWERIVGWCRSEAPVTAAGLRPPASREARRAAEAATNGAWPDDLHRWYALQDGVVGHPYAVIFPGFWPLPLDDVVRMWGRYQEIARQMDADEVERLRATGARAAERDRLRAVQRSIDQREGREASQERFYDVARHEAAPAGAVAGMFLPSFIPVGDDGSGCALALDLRAGPRLGCVTPYRREDADTDGPRWTSLDALLDDVAGCLETGRPTGYWEPVVHDGLLGWDIN
jgi:cell wall assembly regulator SMI1